MSKAADQARAELAAMRATMAYAFAHAHGCTYGHDPQHGPLLERERHLLAVIREHDGGGEQQ